MTMNWNPQSHDEYDTLKGLDVFTADDRRIGKVMHVYHPNPERPDQREHYFMVEPDIQPNPFKASEVFFPEGDIRAVNRDEDRVVLEVSTDKLKDKDWNQPPDFNRYEQSVM